MCNTFRRVTFVNDTESLAFECEKMFSIISSTTAAAAAVTGKAKPVAAPMVHDDYSCNLDFINGNSIPITIR